MWLEYVVKADVVGLMETKIKFLQHEIRYLLFQ